MKILAEPLWDRVSLRSLTAMHLRSSLTLYFIALGFPLVTPHLVWAQSPSSPLIGQGDDLISKYFENQVRQITQQDLTQLASEQEWLESRKIARQQLAEMLGLDPMPERTPLKVVVTKTIEADEFVVECLHFQSSPGLYVTANLYRPKNVEGKLPAILYGCGHGKMTKDGVSLGNKTQYQHHGAWFARNGYLCLVIDTIQLGEIEGEHHGTYRLGRWWWNQRGYTPAGVETWNCIRAIDYLATRDDVDAERIGMTGRSGGGAYTWWAAAMDERIKVAVPVAGITTLQNHVVDGCIEGHCDCMYMVNHHRWDFPKLSALIAPRPLLISNTDKDSIFPLEGVVEVHRQVRHIYRLLQSEDRLGLQITEGPHKDTQELQVHAMSWFNRFLKNENPIITSQATPFFAPEELKVFKSLPNDEITSRIDESFVPIARSTRFTSWKHVEGQVLNRLSDLKEWTFRSWPAKQNIAPLNPTLTRLGQRGQHSLYRLQFAGEAPYRLQAYLIIPEKSSLNESARLEIAGAESWGRWAKAIALIEPQSLPGVIASETEWEQLVLHNDHRLIALVVPRGIGPTAWSGDEKKQTHIRRRFMLLGETLASEQVWDAVRGVEAIRSAMPDAVSGEVDLAGEAAAAYVALYASLFIPQINQLDLRQLASDHADAPDMLHVARLSTLADQLLIAARQVRRLKLSGNAENLSKWQTCLEPMPWTAERIQLAK